MPKQIQARTRHAVQAEILDAQADLDRERGRADRDAAAIRAAMDLRDALLDELLAYIDVQTQEA